MDQVVTTLHLTPLERRANLPHGVRKALGLRPGSKVVAHLWAPDGEVGSCGIRVSRDLRLTIPHSLADHVPPHGWGMFLLARK